MSELVAAEVPPHTNGVPEDADDDERGKMRPADIDADVKEMEKRKRVEMIMGSRLFREELERIIESQMKDGGGPAGLIQQIQDMVGGASRLHAGSMFRNTNCVTPINDIRGVESMGYAKGEKLLRCKMACVFRLMDLYGWTHGIHNQITARLSQEQEHFIVNPFGMLYHEITASSLVKVDMQGSVVEQGTTNFGVDMSKFQLHGAVHAARPDVKCVIHIHTPSVVAISSLKAGLLPLGREAAVLGEVSTHRFYGGVTEPEERDKITRSLGPINKVLLLSNAGALCCGETVEEAFYNVYNTVLACETQVKLMPMGVDNLDILPDEARKAMYDAARKAPEGALPKNATPLPPALEKKEKKWRIGGMEFEALMRMLDNAGFRTGYIYRTPLVKGEPPKPRNDVEVPPAVSSLGYLLEEEEMYRQGQWKKGAYSKNDRTRWLNSPNVYQKVEILETGTTDPKKITKWVDANNQEEWVTDGSPTHTSTPVKIDAALQFVPKNTNPKEFKKLQQQIKENRRADKITSGPQSHILEGVTWEEAKKLQDASISMTGDHVIQIGAASKGIIQRGFQHNATVYKTPYAKNPFDCVSDAELEDYKKVVTRKQKGDYYDEDASESEPLSSSAALPLEIKSPPSETEDDSRTEPRVLRIETKTAPVPSQAEMVLSDDETQKSDGPVKYKVKILSFKELRGWNKCPSPIPEEDEEGEKQDEEIGEKFLKFEENDLGKDEMCCSQNGSAKERGDFIESNLKKAGTCDRRNGGNGGESHKLVDLNQPSFELPKWFTRGDTSRSGVVKITSSSQTSEELESSLNSDDSTFRIHCRCCSRKTETRESSTQTMLRIWMEECGSEFESGTKAQEPTRWPQTPQSSIPKKSPYEEEMSRRRAVMFEIHNEVLMKFESLKKKKVVEPTPSVPMGDVDVEEVSISVYSHSLIDKAGVDMAETKTGFSSDDTGNSVEFPSLEDEIVDEVRTVGRDDSLQDCIGEEFEGAELMSDQTISETDFGDISPISFTDVADGMKFDDKDSSIFSNSTKYNIKRVSSEHIHSDSALTISINSAEFENGRSSSGGDFAVNHDQSVQVSRVVRFNMGYGDDDRDEYCGNVEESQPGSESAPSIESVSVDDALSSESVSVDEGAIKRKLVFNSISNRGNMSITGKCMISYDSNNSQEKTPSMDCDCPEESPKIDHLDNTAAKPSECAEESPKTYNLDDTAAKPSECAEESPKTYNLDDTAAKPSECAEESPKTYNLDDTAAKPSECAEESPKTYDLDDTAAKPSECALFTQHEESCFLVGDPEPIHGKDQEVLPGKMSSTSHLDPPEIDCNFDVAVGIDLVTEELVNSGQIEAAVTGPPNSSFVEQIQSDPPINDEYFEMEANINIIEKLLLDEHEPKVDGGLQLTEHTEEDCNLTGILAVTINPISKLSSLCAKVIFDQQYNYYLRDDLPSCSENFSEATPAYSSVIDGSVIDGATKSKRAAPVTDQPDVNQNVVKERSLESMSVDQLMGKQVSGLHSIKSLLDQNLSDMDPHKLQVGECGAFDALYLNQPQNNRNELCSKGFPCDENVSNDYGYDENTPYVTKKRPKKKRNRSKFHQEQMHEVPNRLEQEESTSFASISTKYDTACANTSDTSQFHSVCHLPQATPDIWCTCGMSTVCSTPRFTYSALETARANLSLIRRVNPSTSVGSSFEVSDTSPEAPFGLTTQHQNILHRSVYCGNSLPCHKCSWFDQQHYQSYPQETSPSFCFCKCAGQCVSPVSYATGNALPYFSNDAYNSDESDLSGSWCAEDAVPNEYRQDVAIGRMYRENSCDFIATLDTNSDSAIGNENDPVSASIDYSSPDLASLFSNPQDDSPDSGYRADAENTQSHSHLFTPIGFDSLTPSPSSTQRLSAVEQFLLFEKACNSIPPTTESPIPSPRSSLDHSRSLYTIFESSETTQ